MVFQFKIGCISLKCRPVIRLSLDGNLIAAECRLHLLASRQEICHRHQLICGTGLEALLIELLRQIEIPPLVLTPESLV